MGGGNLMVFVLDEMQMLDEKIAPPRPLSEQSSISCAAVGSTWRPLGV